MCLLPVRYIECGYKESNEFPKVTDEWEEYNIGDKFGGYDKHFWMHISFESPLCDENHELRFSLSTSHAKVFRACRNPQCILYVNGKMVAGLDLNHTEYVIEPGKQYEVYIYLYTGLHNAYYDLDMGIVSLDKITNSLYYDMKTAYDAAKLFDVETFEHIETIKQLNIAANYLDFTEPGGCAYYEGVEKAIDYLSDNYYGKYPKHIATVDCVGHTHIDVAWLWTYAQTAEKVQRSFSTVTYLMKRYPEYKFMISQPVLLEYLKNQAPEVFEEIKRLVKEGRIEFEGAMWVEADCDIPSGESLIRQILFGKEYFKKEFDVDSETLWLPDVFGYSATLPQIMNKTGVKRFVTSKLGWNEFNEMPYDIFKWIGIDGSDIITHFMTCQDCRSELFATDYTGNILPEYVLGTWNRQQQKEYTKEVFMTYGYGDGGGGPTEEMLEYEKRIRRGIPGLSSTRLTTASESLNNIEATFYENVEKMGRYSKWSEELYLEFHRGTYTSVGKIKRYNRKCEFLLQNAEKISVLSMLLADSEYNREIIDKSWKTVLLNQFHDVIPGSSIHEVYEDCYRMLDETIGDLSSVLKLETGKLAAKVKGNGKLMVFNPNGFEVTDVVRYNDKYITVKDVPAMGWKTVGDEQEDYYVQARNREIENDYYRVIFDEDYDIISIYDKKNNREVIREGRKANEFIFYEDLSYSYDAWELSVYHKEKKYKVDEVISCKPIFEGARAGFEIKKRFRNSYIVQNIYLYNSLPRIDFETKVDWSLRHIIFKTAFPVDVNTNTATYEIQFGNVERSHIENTSWDIAKFETCAHKWADISDNGYGLALMNDCKYGYSVVDESTIQLTVLRSGNSSIEEVNDQGEHILSYSIVPHKGNYIEGDITKLAYSFNNPLICKCIEGSDETLPEEFTFVKVQENNIITDTVKLAENKDGIIVRLYESQNIKQNINIEFGVDVKKVYICDMLENIEKQIEVKNNRISLPVSNFEIVTLKVEL